MPTGIPFSRIASEVPLNGEPAKGKRPPRRQRSATRAAFANFREEERFTEANGTELSVIGLPLSTIAGDLFKLTHNWPKRVGPLLFAEGKDHRPLWLASSEAVFAWIGGRLPLQGLANPVVWTKGSDKVSKAEFVAHLQQTAEDFDAVEAFPHYPSMPRHYYMHAKPTGGDGKALRSLLKRFRPSTNVDADLIHALFLTPFWGGPPGQRPAFLIDAEEDDPQGGRGVGKTKLGQAVAHLAGGHIDARPGEDMDKLMTRLLSAVALDRRIVLLDNVKALRFSWADLEALVTADVISGRQLYVGEGRRPNTLLWVITLNSAGLSRDLAQRCVIVRVKRAPRNPKWEADTWSYIDRHRWEIIGDILAELRSSTRPLTRYSRWSAWESAVLAHVAEPAECLKVIEERQAAVDDDAAEADTVREALVVELSRRGHDPDAEVVWVPSADIAQIVNAATGERRPVNKATAYLGTLTIKELRRSNRADARGWTWWGKDADPSRQAVRINPMPL